jgi:hypothetical protein
MAGARKLGPVGTNPFNPQHLDDGTSARTVSPTPGHLPARTRGGNDVLLSSGVQVATDAAFSISPNLTWDAYWRLIYERTTDAIQRQAKMLVARGNVTAQEARSLVESQRNALVLEMRNRVSPFGRLYSELLKPSSGLPTLEQLVERKGSIEAVLQSVGKSRAVVNRFAAISRVGGPTMIVIQITLTAVVIVEAPPDQRRLVTSREIGGVVGAASFGSAGMWAGCFAFSAAVSPSLVLPVVGEVTTGGACLVGGLVGGLGLGWAGHQLGRQAGENIYNFATQMRWIQG